jgi:hypothetical protein
VRSGTALDELVKLTPRDLRDVQERPERARRDQRIARPPENASGLRPLIGKPAQEHGLANTRLAPDKKESPKRAGTHARKGIFKSGEALSPLEQVAFRIEERSPPGSHERMVPSLAGSFNDARK